MKKFAPGEVEKLVNEVLAEVEKNKHAAQPAARKDEKKMSTTKETTQYSNPSDPTPANLPTETAFLKSAEALINKTGDVIGRATALYKQATDAVGDGCSRLQNDESLAPANLNTQRTELRAKQNAIVLSQSSAAVKLIESARKLWLGHNKSLEGLLSAKTQTGSVDPIALEARVNIEADKFAILFSRAGQTSAAIAELVDGKICQSLAEGDSEGSQVILLGAARALSRSKGDLSPLNKLQKKLDRSINGRLDRAGLAGVVDQAKSGMSRSLSKLDSSACAAIERAGASIQTLAAAAQRF